MDKEDKPNFSTETKKKPIIIELDKESEKIDYDKLVADNQEHPLVRASREYLKVQSNCDLSDQKSDLDHNLALFQKGLSPHYGSRANNVIPSYEFDKLKQTFPHSVNVAFPMNRRIVNILNLYRLKTGERNGCYLGANVFDYSSDLSNGGDQKYIATEAPYDKLDYYRMVIDSNARILVSLTTDVDDSEKGAFPKIRNGIKTNIHHLQKGEKLKVDDYEITEEGEIVKTFKSTKDLLVKTITISKEDKKRTLHHLIYKQWPDGGLVSSSDEIADLILTIHQSEKQLESTSSHPIVVNCGYGYGRTGVLILMHQISKMIPTDLQQYDLSNITVNVEPMISATEAKIAEGSPIGLKHEGTEKRIHDLKRLAEGMVNILVETVQY